jgi:hypothetical protein
MLSFYLDLDKKLNKNYERYYLKKKHFILYYDFLD